MRSDSAAGDALDGDAPDGPPRALLIAALAVAVLAVGAVLAVAATRRTPVPPVAIAAVPAPQAGAPQCRSLLATLPEQLGDYTRAVAIDPVPDGAAAWRPPDTTGGDPVIMRCGLDRPAEFVVGVPLQMVDDVQWLRLTDADTRRSTWVAVDRAVYVAITLPDGSGPTPIQTLSDVIARTMPAMPIRPGPAT
jgi:hypothetical protein